MRRFFKLALFPALLGVGWAAWDQLAPVDPDGWRSDLDTLAAHTAAAYANLDWQVAAGRVDPADLHARTDSALAAAHTRRQARAALRDFARAFGDGSLYNRPNSHRFSRPVRFSSTAAY